MNNQEKVYLDWAATYKPNIEAIKNANEKAFKYFANPSSVHGLGIEAKAALENARLEIAQSIGAKSQQIYFTSGGTESNHLPMLSVLTKPNPQSYSIAISSIEHSAISKQAEALSRLGVEVLKIPVNSAGIVTSDAVLQTIKDNTVFVSVMLVNNVMGAIQPIKEIYEQLQKTAKRKIHIHTDAVQAVGKIKVDVSELGVDSLAFAGHKIGASRGIGALYLKNSLSSFLKGGGQEFGVRSGTENLAGIFSLQSCIKDMTDNIDKNIKTVNSTMDYLISEIVQMSNIVLIPANRELESNNFSPYILQFADEKITGEVLTRCLSDEGVFVSTGSACSSKKKTKPILSEMGIRAGLQQNTIRISIGHSTTKAEIDLFLEALKKVKNILS
ncbi:MAG: aminotransferase [Treponema sp.]|nr:MAG: aminotransferase [Treponema sp.]